MECLICSYANDDLKRFSDHLRSSHGLTSEQYTMKYLCDGVRPSCPVCTSPVRYVSFSYKKYCKDHARLAMKEGGAVGGKADAWNKGKTKEDDSRIAIQAEKTSGAGNHFYGKRHTQEVLRKISLSKTLDSTTIEERIIQRSHEFTLLTSLDEYRSRQQQYLVFKCVTCGEVQPKTLQAFERGSRCYKCHPVGKSNWELSVYDYVKSVSADAVSGDKSVISPKEIDVYVPSRNFGIECHGLYWHSEAGRPEEEFNKHAHLEKSNLASAANVNLLQLFEDEWRDKRHIVESMIQHRLGLHNVRCKTWSTQVVEMSTIEQRNFFNDTHISGYTPCKACWGLRDKSGDIVAALSVRIPRHADKYGGSIEVARFSLARGVSVPGALSKLLKCAKRWAVADGHDNIMTYVDRRIGSGKGYTAAGFQRIGDTGVDYWYTDNEYRYDRFKFRAHEGRSEKQVAYAAGVSRIYGCGSAIFMIDLKKL